MHHVHNYIDGFVCSDQAFYITEYVEDDEVDSLAILDILIDESDDIPF